MERTDINQIFKRVGIVLLMGILMLGISCKQNTRENEDRLLQTPVDTTQTVREVEPRGFTGEIKSVGNHADNLSGKVAMRIEGDLMRFDITAEGLAPDMMHMQYLLVSQSGDETQCPGSVEDLTTSEEDNGSIAASGTTLRRIPLHMGGTLDLQSDTYPRTNINGELRFSHVISLDSLRQSVKNEFQMQELDFTKFTFVIRGIPDAQSSTAPVRGSAGSVENTPVGCAKLQETVLNN